MHTYNRSSGFRRFFMNLFFFFITPCLWCCGKCCGWHDGLSDDSNEKGHHLKKQLIIKQEQYHAYSKEEDDLSSDAESDVPSETHNLLYSFNNNKNKTVHHNEQENNRHSNKQNNNKYNERNGSCSYKKGNVDNNNGRCMPDVTPKNNRLKGAGFQPVLDTENIINNEEEEEEDTSFVLSALTESRDSLKVLVSSG